MLASGVCMILFFLATSLWKKMLQIMSVGEYESFWIGEEKKSVDETAVGNA